MEQQQHIAYIIVTPAPSKYGRFVESGVLDLEFEWRLTGNTSSPGNAYNAFSVGAVEKMGRNRTEVAFFSSGPSLVFPGEEPTPLVHKPDVVAPGVHIYSCIPPEKTPGGSLDYTYMDGSSMATAHVAGVAALLMAAKPRAGIPDIIGVLKDTAKHPRGAKKRPDNRWGYGRVQPVDALKAL